MQIISKNKFIRSLILFLLGALCVLGFAPFYFYPASILSLIGLFYFWHQDYTSKQAAISGFIYGLGLFSTGIYWIYISLHDFGNMPSVIAGLATFLLCAFMALFTALVGAFSVKISKAQPPQLLISIPIFWALADWTRSWIFTGFPWLTMGYSQVPHSPLAGYMPIIGVYGVSMIMVLIASLIGFWLAKQPATLLWKRNTIVLLLLIWVTGSLLKLVEWTTPTSEPISVALLQGNISQDIKWSPEVAEKTLSLYLQMAEASKAKLIIMPETAMPVLSSQIPQEIITRLQTHAVQNQGTILVGAVEHDNDAYFNSMLSINGSKLEAYRKSHLVPFGEFIPLKVAFGWIYRDLLNMPLSDLTRGSIHQQPMSIAGEKVAINICYEDVFGEEIIRQLPAATLLVNASNDAWYGQSNAAFQHMQFSQARALETGRTILRATNTGATAIIDPHGNVLAHAPHFTETTLNGTAQGYSGSTPYVRWGNRLFLIICLIGLSAICLPNFLASKHKTK
ncbi:MAG: apolipoprotein N-acyltransferase [Methylotenera sp.]|uniref:apolipoprotein N-acyltransferase n=1 Tax=Methylotenera sp. TaxID=2051956 RepID=UPI002487F134|nr:apolipoprotein N-acyltransferase [Methylotenera sp.]MDI1310019.1 apolipoprotein N-acyltransferase [Methylotenera sp.]